MQLINEDDPLAVSAIEAIKAGEFRVLHSLLTANPNLAEVYIGTASEARTLLHIATDWPGHLPWTSATIHVIVQAGGDVDAPFVGPLHEETPLHWAASCDDVSAINALLDENANIEAPGGVIAGGTPLTDAVAFRQWRAARRLVERGAKTTLNSAAALGLLSRLQSALSDGNDLSQEELDFAFWYACHGGRLATAKFLHGAGANVHVTPPWSQEGTALDAAKETDAGGEATESELVVWLRSIGVKCSKP